MLRLNRAAGLFIVAALVGAVLFPFGSGQYLWQAVLEDSAHGPVFAGIATALLLMTPPTTPGPEVPRRSGRVYLRTFVLAALIGIATEIIQMYEPGRDPSVHDAFHDACGAAFALAVLALIERAGPRRWLVALAAAAFLTLAFPAAQIAIAYAHRAVEFPVLASGRSRLDLTFLRAHRGVLERRPLPAPWGRPGEGDALWLGPEGRDAPSFELFEPAPDWRGRRMLSLDVTNPGPRPLSMVLSVLDAEHDWSTDDRFNGPLLLPPATRTTIRVAVAAIETAPRSRRMDLSRIANLMLYCRGCAPGSEFYVSQVRLD